MEHQRVLRRGGIIAGLRLEHRNANLPGCYRQAHVPHAALSLAVGERYAVIVVEPLCTMLLRASATGVDVEGDVAGEGILGVTCGQGGRYDRGGAYVEGKSIEGSLSDNIAGALQQLVRPEIVPFALRQVDRTGLQPGREDGCDEEVRAEKELVVEVPGALICGIVPQKRPRGRGAVTCRLVEEPVDVGKQMIAQLHVVSCDVLGLGAEGPRLMRAGTGRGMCPEEGHERGRLDPA